MTFVLVENTMANPTRIHGGCVHDISLGAARDYPRVHHWQIAKTQQRFCWQRDSHGLSGENCTVQYSLPPDIPLRTPRNYLFFREALKN